MDELSFYEHNVNRLLIVYCIAHKSDSFNFCNWNAHISYEIKVKEDKGMFCYTVQFWINDIE